MEYDGLGRASEQLHLSQPVASRQIRALESELGIALFERVGRRLRLTPEGTICCVALAVCWPMPI